MSELGETPGNKTVRLGMENRITKFYEAGDTFRADNLLGRYPLDTARPELSREELIERLHNPNVARFFRPIVIEGLREFPEAA